MATNTGESEQGLRKVIDLTRGISILLLFLHFYFYFGKIFRDWGYTTRITDRLIYNIAHTGLFDHFYTSKTLALGFLFISFMGIRGKKDPGLRVGTGLLILGIGLSIYFTSGFIFYFNLPPGGIAFVYILLTVGGYLFILSGGALVSRVIGIKLDRKDIFNRENESFPQQEKCIENDYSINFATNYLLRGRLRNGWINIINPFRGLLVLGSPGSGKSYFIVQQLIRQHIQKGFAMFIYDFKFDDLSKIAYNYFLLFKTKYPVTPSFYVLNFDDLQHTHRCNPLNVSEMEDISDAAESARTILFAINRSWISRQGDFFVESPIHFVTCIIWFLRKYRDGRFCTLPHVIELINVEYEKLFAILRTEPEIEVIINPFVSSLVNRAMDQLEGQVGGAKIAMARLSSPHLYYVLSGNDFNLDINDPNEPKIFCMGNNPQKQLVYNAVLSLLATRLIKLVNKKGKMKSSLVFDELPTIYIGGVDGLLATARSNKVATTLVVQDLSQLKKDYGRDQADVIMNITGNIICGQVSGDTAKQISDRFGRIIQDRGSFSINSTDTSISRSFQLDMALPPSKIASLSSGEFVGLMADDPDNPVDLKSFHAKIDMDHVGLKKEQNKFQPIPIIRRIDKAAIQHNYLQIKKDIEDLVQAELERISNDPALADRMINRQG
jgi:hypothetical protein